MAPPNQQKHQHGQCDADSSKVTLNSAVLQLRHQFAAETHTTTALIETQVNDEVVDGSVQGGKCKHDIGAHLHGTTDNHSIHPCAGLCPACVQPDETPLVYFIYKIFPLEKMVDIGLGPLE